LPRWSNADARADTFAEREQLDLFHALPGDLAPRDAQDLMAYPFFSLAKSKRIVPIDFRAGKISIRVEAVPEHGMATIWDADVLIWAASQIAEARDARFEDVAPDGGDALRDPDPLSAVAPARAITTASKPRSIGCNRRPS